MEPTLFLELILLAFANQPVVRIQATTTSRRTELSGETNIRLMMQQLEGRRALVTGLNIGDFTLDNVVSVVLEHRGTGAFRWFGIKEV